MPARIQVLSDLHLEYERVGLGQPGLYEYNFDKADDVENLAILGDLGSTDDDRFFDWLDVQLARFKRVFFVAGNHEPYQQTLVESNTKLREFANRPRPPGQGEFIFLDRNRYNLNESITILGCTLWSSLNPDDLDILSWALTDFKRIQSFTPAVYMEQHTKDVAWLNEQLEDIRTREPERTIVVFTHHAPTMDGTGDPKFLGGPTASAFATELTQESWWTGPPLSVWCFGHTHYCCDFERGGVRVYSNQRGYGSGGPGYDASKVIDV